MASIIPPGQLCDTTRNDDGPNCPIPMAVVAQALENMDYEVVELAPDRIGARCHGHMPNFHVLTTTTGFDLRSWWKTDPLADRAAILDAVNEANFHARTWRYSISSDGNLLVDRAIVHLGNGEVTAEDLQGIIFDGSLEMILSMKHFLGELMA